MTDYEIYVFLLCTIVFVMLTALSAICLWIITRLSLRLIDSGAQDIEILEDHVNEKRKYRRAFVKRLDYVFTGIVCLAFIFAFSVSFYISHNESAENTFATYRVVRTSSMEEKHPKNKYLFDNKLDDQLKTFDLIYTEELPDEMELELYDIVVYEIDDVLIIHRIVGIEEPNEKHPDCRYFRLQGDANESQDRNNVLYEQMRGIYKGQRIPNIGSFILFMQSPAGWLCILLLVISMIATPILNKVLSNARKRRVAFVYARMAGIYDD